MDSAPVLVHVEEDDDDDDDEGSEHWAGEAHPADSAAISRSADGHYETNAFIQPHKYDTPRTPEELDARIRKQVEFLFSDSNIHKDKFMQRFVRGDHPKGVPIAALATFYRIAVLSQNPEIIRRAVMSSTALRLCSDGVSLERTTPYTPLPPEYFDDRTIYVESLPQYTHHEALREYFEPFGAVTHVSLPRFRRSRKFKGFAFVEFSTAAGAVAAVAGHKELKESRKGGGSWTPEAGGMWAGMTVMMKSDWMAWKEASKAASKAADATLRSIVPSAQPKVISLDPSRGCVLRVSGIPFGPGLSTFQLLRDAVSIAGRPRYIDCPLLFSAPRPPGQRIEPRVDTRRGKDAPTTATPLKLAHSTSQSDPDTKFITATVRYWTPADASAALKYFTAEHNPPVILFGTPITAHGIEGEEEEEYLRKVREQQEAYATAKAAKGKPSAHLPPPPTTQQQHHHSNVGVGQKRKGDMDGSIEPAPAAKKARTSSPLPPPHP